MKNLDPMKQLSVLASATGFVLAVIYFGALWQGVKPYEWMPMMVTAIGGFELYLFAQEQWRRISGRGPGGPNG